MNPLATTVMRTHRYKALHRCIYCLTAVGPFSEEHIIPYSLNGTLTLPEAVCGACRKTVDPPEQKMLNEGLLVPRRLLSLRSRSRKKRRSPKKLPKVFLNRDGMAAKSFELEGDDVQDIDQYPRTFLMMKTFPAGFLTGNDQGETAELLDPVECSLRLGTPTTTTSFTIEHHIEPWAFAYSLAKWAYSFAVAERGLGCCNTRAMRELLANERRDVFNFVGGILEDERARRGHLHTLSFRQRGPWLTVVVHLFAFSDSPQYEVVIGATRTLTEEESRLNPIDGVMTAEITGQHWRPETGWVAQLAPDSEMNRRLLNLGYSEAEDLP